MLFHKYFYISFNFEKLLLKRVILIQSIIVTLLPSMMSGEILLEGCGLAVRRDVAVDEWPKITILRSL